MKLGRWCYAKVGTAHQSPFLSSPGSVGRLNLGRRHLSFRMMQGLIGIMLFCMFLLVFPLSLLSTHAQPTISTTLAFDDGNSNAIAVPQHQRKDNANDLQVNLEFAPETSGNYNYLYNDGGDNYQDEGETIVNSKLKNNTNSDESSNINSENNRVSFKSKSGGVSEAVLTRRRNKLLQNSHYKQRQKLLDSVFISVKTTKRFHSTRLEPILKTWFNLAREQTWIFTDADDPVLDRRTGGHMINTNCPSTHYREGLCCKMSAEFDTFIHSGKSWFCHVDDDNYLNVPALLDLLEKHDAKEYWYLGKPSLKKPIHFKENKSDDVSFSFGTGGAGFCLSRALALRMSPLASGGKFMKLCDRIQLPDDVTIGYVAGHLLAQKLTVIPQFHSHFETMKFITTKNPESEITFSYLRMGDNVNILDVQGYFTEEEDPTRFLSLHCLLFPNFSFCPKGERRR